MQINTRNSGRAKMGGLLFALATIFVILTGNPHIAGGATLTVDATSDGGDSNTGDGLCNDGAGNCTLRAAIEQANNLAGADDIDFDIGGGGAQTIVLASILPTITGTLTVDGSSQPGFSGTSLITIDAGGLGGSTLSVSGVAATLQWMKVAGAAGTAVALVFASNSVLDELDLGDDPGAYPNDTGVATSFSDSLTLSNLNIVNRTTAITINGSSVAELRCNRVVSNSTGFDFTDLSGETIFDNNFRGNGTAVVNNSAPLINAENNYWGAADGSATDGGSGDTHSANVDAVPFLAASPVCSVPVTLLQLHVE